MQTYPLNLLNRNYAFFEYSNPYHENEYTDEQVEKIATSRIKDEIKAGIQTIQYQINTFSTTNGQAPFLSVFMYLREEPEYIKETAMLIEETLRQRYVGMKNPVGAYVTPAFPKLLYVLDDDFKRAKAP